MDVEDKCVIDSNALVAERVEEWENLRRANAAALPVFDEEDGEGSGEFTSGIAGEELDALFEDGEGASNVIKAAEQPGVDLEEARAEAQAILDEARAEAERILADARSQCEMLRADAVEEGTRQGFEEGHQKGLAEVDGMKRELAEQKRALEAEYDEMLENLEPRFIETITDVYSHIFGVDLMDNRDILVHLIDSTLRKVESSRTFIVHVSADDYPHVNMQKQTLMEGAAAGRGLIEIIEDIALSKGDCLIETDGGIFDCGVGTQLEELTKKLQVLSYEKV
ncbi:MAG: FliH/SctL family protein [Bacteroidales bacterium]|nr:FliH/SctL family protein [Bacteroidales bacterium]MCM1415138.1 FliH/SctL family protein [bacterium]MCM1423026.1 FliH/SctL family protein [bacterium]